MSKRMKRFILNSVRAVLALGVIAVVYGQVGPIVAGDDFTLVLWAIRFVMVAVLGFIAWRFCVGIRSGRLLFDEIDD
jgi:hypothetical protein